MEQNNHSSTRNSNSTRKRAASGGTPVLAATTLGAPGPGPGPGQSQGQGQGQGRVPLKETSGNIPSPVLKKARIHKPVGNSSKSLLQNKPHLAAQSHSETQAALAPAQSVAGETQSNRSNRLEGEAFYQWQRSWRKIMKESVVYFDTQGYDSSNPVQQAELRKAQRALKQVDCAIVPFYDREVTIIISRRSYDANKEYPSNDIFNDASNLKIKVWDYDKVFRFLKNLGVTESSGRNDANKTGDLYNLLKEEKIFGSADRDPNARRDDLHYLEKNYLYAYDLSQNVRPIAVREWSDDSLPTLNLTLDGKCPFIPDTSENLERKILRRLQKFEATKKYRMLLKKATSDIINNSKEGANLNPQKFNGTSTSTDRDDNEEGNDNESTISQSSTSTSKKNEEEAASKQSKDVVGGASAQPAHLLRESSCVQPLNNSNSKFYDVAASGYNGASNAVQISVDSALNSAAAQGNGLGPTISQVPSRNLNNLKRRIFMKKQKQHNESIQEEKDKELKPGYCENCRVKYNYFEEHISSNRHRNFAFDDRNFKDIDKLISALNESKSLGFVTSNGDYQFSN